MIIYLYIYLCITGRPSSPPPSNDLFDAPPIPLLTTSSRSPSRDGSELNPK